jgi:hypothetical protein
VHNSEFGALFRFPPRMPRNDALTQQMSSLRRSRLSASRAIARAVGKMLVNAGVDERWLVHLGLARTQVCSLALGQTDCLALFRHHRPDAALGAKTDFGNVYFTRVAVPRALTGKPTNPTQKSWRG